MKTNNISFKQLKTFLKEDASNTDIQSYISKYEKNGVVDLNPIQSNKTFVREILNNSDKFPELTFKLPENCNALFGNQNVIVQPNWNVSNVEDMSYMFYNAKIENAKALSFWDVSNVISLFCMFAHSNFNQDISNWDVSTVTDMSYMFYDTSFNQDISSWDLSSIKTKYHVESMFYNSKFSFKDKIKHWPFVDYMF